MRSEGSVAWAEAMKKLGLVTAALLTIIILVAAPTTRAQNSVQVENAKPGSPDWQLTNPATNHEIEGYASLTSVNRGGQIGFLVNTADPTFTLDVYRTGWYGGAGARQMMASVQLNGTRQAIPTPNPTTGIVECQWINPYVLNIPYSSSDPTLWPSGVYLARLTGNSSGKQSFILFIVRDDARPSTYLYQLSTNTFQAYNGWGGKSLYGFNSTNGSPAIFVSFNRPYGMGSQPNSASGVGAGEFLTNVQAASVTQPAGWAYNMLRFLEREGYDTTYIADVDSHENQALLLSHKALLVVGHSEYWSWQMRFNTQAARDAGVGLGFFSSNTCYWQIRFAPSAITGAADRTIIAYKALANFDPDSMNSATVNLTTTQWRLPPVNLPEETLVGEMYGSLVTPNEGIAVSNPSHWIYTFTNLLAGAFFPGILGDELDYMHGSQPAGTVAFAHESIPGDSTVYTAASGATVFAAGTFSWSWGLDDYNVPGIRQSVISPALQQMTRNVLARLAGQPFSPSFSITASPRVQTISVNAGMTATYTIPVTSFGYFPTVSLSVSGLPANVSYGFAPSTIAGSGSSVLSITPTSSTVFGTYLLTISATDGIQTRTEAVSLIVGYVGFDASTQGNWQGKYGADGYAIANGQQSLPSYVNFSVQNQLNYTWASGTTDARALPAGTLGRIASCWYNNPSFSFDVNITDGKGHQIALYVLDWDSNGARAETVQVVNANTNAILGSQSVANFGGGTYLVWNVSGHVKINVITTGGPNAVVSGVFFSTPNSQVAPTFTTASSATFTMGSAGSFVVSASGSPAASLTELGSLPSGVTFNASTGALAGTPAAGSNGTYPLTFTATNGVSPGASQNFMLTVASGGAPSSRASFVGVDSATQGNWQGKYGTDGYAMAGSAQNLPSYSTFMPQNYLLYTWAANTTDARALRLPNSSTGMATTWYSSSSFSYDINLTDGKTHPIALYMVDWDGGGTRAEKIQIIDANNPNNVLDTESVVNFPNGVYLMWNISGHVTINVTLTGGVNAVVSGVFWGQLTGNAATFLRYDTTTQGNWQGRYGADGSSIANYAQVLPSYATLAVQNQLNYIWISGTSDPRALQAGTLGRIASCWYNIPIFNFELNITDGQVHQLAMYVLDWDGSGTRAETIQILDAFSNAVLATQTVSAFTNGTYLVWSVSGHVKINVTRTGGVNSVMSGLFFN